MRAEDRPASNRIIMDEMAHKSHEQCPGFNFSSVDEATGRSITSSLGVSHLSDFRAQQTSTSAAKKDQGEVIGKIAFYKDSTMENNAIERIMGQWVKQFHDTLAMHCVRAPRYSELRPLQF